MSNPPKIYSREDGTCWIVVCDEMAVNIVDLYPLKRPVEASFPRVLS